MANAIFPKWKSALLQASSNSALTGTVKVALVDTGVYTYSDTHEFYSDLSGVVGTDQTIGSKTYTNGVFDGADVIFTGVTGNSIEALVIYISTGTPGTSRLVCYLDSDVLALPLSPNSGDIAVTFNAAGIFRL